MHSIIKSISSQFIHKVDHGVTTDLRDFLDQNNLVKDYEIITTDDDKYIVTVRLNDFEKSKVKDVFYSLMRFVDYQTTFFTHEVDSKSITYYLSSMSLEYDLGFYFTIIFCQG